jgi:hypothetical protein
LCCRPQWAPPQSPLRWPPASCSTAETRGGLRSFSTSWSATEGSRGRFLPCRATYTPTTTQPGETARVVRHFELGGPAERFEALDWGHAPRYLVAAGDNWLLLWLPAYEILDDCCRGYYVAAVKPGLTAERGPATLDLTTEEGDYARATVQVKAGIAEAVLEFWPVKARSARVELVADLGPRQMKLKLAESRGGTSTGAVIVAGRPGVYVIKGACVSLRDWHLRHRAGPDMGARPRRLQGKARHRQTLEVRRHSRSPTLSRASADCVRHNALQKPRGRSGGGSRRVKTRCMFRLASP